MKQVLIFIASIFLITNINAQSVGIGTAEPLNKLQVQGSLLVTAPKAATSTAPTAAQTKTIINSGTINFAASDSTGRIYDPGGPTGNYLPSVTGDVLINGNSLVGSGVELVIESMQLGIGDSLIIEESSSSAYLFAVGNGYSTIGKWVFNSSGVRIIFKSNADANVGSGFSLLFRRLYNNGSTLPDVSGYTGNSFFFDAKRGSVRSGLISNEPIGTYSTAIGWETTASNSACTAMGLGAKASGSVSTAMGWLSTAAGDFSLATGGFTNASGNSSTAMGVTTTASGQVSTAMGLQSTASGLVSTAMGDKTKATGGASTAMGDNTTASGEASTAMGNNTIASGSYSTAMGFSTKSLGFGNTVIGMYNDSILLNPQTVATSTTPLFIIGNGINASTRSNAMVVLRNGNIGIGTNAPAANLHIRHAGGGGLLLENENDNNKWRIYSASGDNNLTFYNNAGTEIADIDDGTGTFNALSDRRFKKNIQGMKPVLPLLMKLRPAYYHFNWQQHHEPLQIGMLAQETYQLFPELVSYNKTNDVYKMNYAGFSTVAIKAIQEQQKEIEALKARLEKLEAILQKQ
jgi:hypothetical protein